MELKLNTPLSIQDIDFRIQSINKGGYATILAYKDARVDMNRLDAVIGVGFWQKKFEIINGNLYCSVGIYNKELAQWVWVQDVGTESMTEKEKGQASDAFKRACFNLGIGRELYDYPVIQVKLNANQENPKNGEWFIENDRVRQGFGLKLKQWKWYSEFDENGHISYLGCRDEKGNPRFSWGTPKAKEEKPSEEKKEALPVITKAQFDKIVERMKAGEDLFKSTVAAFTLTHNEKALLESLSKNKDNGSAKTAN